MSILPWRARGVFAQLAPLFEGLTLAQGSEIVSIGQVRRFSRNQTIFREGDPVNSVVFLISGRLKITQTSRAGAEVILRVVETGEVAGGLGLPAGRAQTVTAQALEPCRVLLWEVRRFQTFCERFPALHRNAARILADRLQTLEECFLELATDQVAPRLARMLVRLSEHSVGPPTDAIRISLSCEELAQMTGTTLFTVSRLLSEWAQRGMISRRRKAVLIHDLPGLIALTKGIESLSKWHTPCVSAREQPIPAVSTPPDTGIQPAGKRLLREHTATNE